MATPVQIVFDCAEPDRLVKFWASALGYEIQAPPEGHASWEEFLVAIGIPEEEWGAASAIVDPDGIGPRIYFQRVPEPKSVKNRVHLDVNIGGRDTPPDESRRRVDAEAERLVELGAVRDRTYDERGEYWVAMYDPEGNEFDIQ